MSGIRVKLSYKQLLTLKHAMQRYLKREDLTEADRQSEEALLQKVEEQISTMQEMMGRSSC